MASPRFAGVSPSPSFGPSPPPPKLRRTTTASADFSLQRPCGRRRPFRRKARSPRVRTSTFAARPPDLRRLALVTTASRSTARSPRSAPPSIRFLFVGPQLRSTLPSRQPRGPALCASLRSLTSSREDFHLQVNAHAGRTKKPPAGDGGVFVWQRRGRRHVG